MTMPPYSTDCVATEALHVQFHVQIHLIETFILPEYSAVITAIYISYLYWFIKIHIMDFNEYPHVLLGITLS
jgi:hypothetical protein